VSDDEGVTIGGPMPWFSVSLSILADDLDPDEVTRLLGVEPDTTRRRGVRWPVPDRPGMSAAGVSKFPARIGLWLIRLRPEQAPDCDVEAAVARLLDRIAVVPPEVWRQACAGAKARVSVALTLDAYNRGFGLGPALLRRVADLDFDVYEGLEDDMRRRTRELLGRLGREWAESSRLKPLAPLPDDGEPEG
jgi:uncharacterized protein DUF4279